MRYESFSAEDTFALGKTLGSKAEAGNIYTLDGDLGAGKTVFAQGFADGMGVSEYVNSPTFTIVSEYESGRLPLYHFDVYRISDPEEMYEIGFEDYLFGDGACLIEWGDIVREILPKETVVIRITRDDSKDCDYRIIEVENE